MQKQHRIGGRRNETALQTRHGVHAWGTETPRGGYILHPTRTGTVIFIALLCLTIFSGCGSKGAGDDGAAGGPAEEIATAENEDALKEAVEAALTPETYKTVSEVSSMEYDGKYSVTIRVVAAGGFFFPDVVEETAAAVFAKAEELGVEIGSYTVEEYTESNTEGIDNMIAWRSTDGETGIFTDGSHGRSIVKMGVTLDGLRDIVG